MQINYSEAHQHKSPDQLRRDKLQLKMKILKADLAPGVVKYMMKPKNDELMQVPLHNVEYHQNNPKPKIKFSKTLQKMNFDPQVQLDEIREEKWSILSRNCKKILEKSRISLGKPVGTSIFRRSSIDASLNNQKINPNKFLSRRQSIELRASEIQSQISPSNLAEKQLLPDVSIPEIKNDQYYNKFKKYYKKIGITKEEQPQVQNKILSKIGTKNIQQKNFKLFSPQRLQQSSYFFPTIQCTPKMLNSAKSKSTQSQYLEEISALFYKAQHFQEEIKKDEIENYGSLSKKVDSIRCELNKLHKIINNDDSNENVEIK